MGPKTRQDVLKNWKSLCPASPPCSLVTITTEWFRIQLRYLIITFNMGWGQNQPSWGIAVYPQFSSDIIQSQWGVQCRPMLFMASNFWKFYITYTAHLVTICITTNKCTIYIMYILDPYICFDNKVSSSGGSSHRNTRSSHQVIQIKH